MHQDEFGKVEAKNCTIDEKLQHVEKQIRNTTNGSKENCMGNNEKVTNTSVSVVGTTNNETDKAKNKRMDVKTGKRRVRRWGKKKKKKFKPKLPKKGIEN